MGHKLCDDGAILRISSKTQCSLKVSTSRDWDIALIENSPAKDSGTSYTPLVEILFKAPDFLWPYQSSCFHRF